LPKQDDHVLLADILDEDQFDEEAAISPVSENESNHFDKFRKIPLGTFWKSQRSRSKLAKKRDLQRAIKRSTNNKVLDSTLLETLPIVSKRISKRKSFLSPMLLAVDESVPSFVSDDIISTYLMPPPFNLN
jgi:hypothetical protein